MADTLRLLRRGRPVLEALEHGVGRQLAKRVIDAGRRVRLRDIHDPAFAGGGSRPAGKPRARAVFEERPVHSESAQHLTRMAIVFVSIVSWCGPDGRTGRPVQGDRLNVRDIARKAGIDEREVSRYLTVWEDAKILVSHQPPKSSGNLKGPSGHCFNLYRLLTVPAELERHLARFHRRWWPRRSVADSYEAPQEVASDHDAADAAKDYVKGLANRGPPPRPS